MVVKLPLKKKHSSKEQVLARLAKQRKRDIFFKCQQIEMAQKCNGRLHVAWFGWEGSPSQKMFKSTHVDLNILCTYRPYSCKHQLIQPKKRCIFREFHRFVSEFGGQIVGLIPLSLSKLGRNYMKLLPIKCLSNWIIWGSQKFMLELYCWWKKSQTTTWDVATTL